MSNLGSIVPLSNLKTPSKHLTYILQMLFEQASKVDPIRNRLHQMGPPESKILSINKVS